MATHEQKEDRYTFSLAGKTVSVVISSLDAAELASLAGAATDERSKNLTRKDGSSPAAEQEDHTPPDLLSLH